MGKKKKIMESLIHLEHRGLELQQAFYAIKRDCNAMHGYMSVVFAEILDHLVEIKRTLAANRKPGVKRSGG